MIKEKSLEDYEGRTIETAETWVPTVDYSSYEVCKSYSMIEIQITSSTQEMDA